MTAVVLAAALAVLVVGIAVLWHMDRREREMERQRALWRARSMRAHAGRCPWSGRLGQLVEGVEWVVQCPRCQEVFVAFGGGDELTLPEHADDRSR